MIVNAGKKTHRRVHFRLKFFILLLMFGVAGYGTWYYVYEAKIFNLKQIDIQGLKSYQKDYFLKNIDVRIDQNILFISKTKIQKKAAILYRIKNVVINRKFPDKLEIIVTERKALYVIIAGDRTYLSDTDGIIFDKTVQEREFALLYIFDRSPAGYQVGKSLPDGDAKKIIGLVRYFPDNIRENISEVSYVNSDIVMYTIDGIKLIWGTELTVASDKLQILEKLPNIKKDVGPLEYVDMRFGNNPVIKSVEGGE